MELLIRNIIFHQYLLDIIVICYNKCRRLQKYLFESSWFEIWVNCLNYYGINFIDLREYKFYAGNVEWCTNCPLNIIRTHKHACHFHFRHRDITKFNLVNSFDRWHCISREVFTIHLWYWMYLCGACIMANASFNI